MIILGIDTSFDDTSVAIVVDGKKVLTNLVISQIKEHEIYGGVIPERASRKHLEVMNIIIQKALDEANLTFNSLDAVAVANCPGLLGSLLVGVNTAKAISFALSIPLIGVHHIQAHIYANFLEYENVPFPSINLVVSGGHTSIIKMDRHLNFIELGSTIDDAAGEAFDKVARILELGIPGGPVIERTSQNGNPDYIKFPRPMLNDGSYDFSFSGLKTSVLRYVEKNTNQRVQDISASFQSAVTDVLVEKTINAALQNRINNVTLTGGVAANEHLRSSFNNKCEFHKLKFFCPSKKLCTDNAAMVACIAFYLHKEGRISDLSLDALATAPIE